ncbi:MAG: M23 family metallopeptidase [Campylobacterales bacterium]|nr:M23 family metallopeptidase [Campylobacterales bacterium]
MNRRDNKSSLGVLLIFGLIIGAGAYVYKSSSFERNAPEIKINNNGHWNLKDPLEVSIDDASGIKSYKIKLKTANGEVDLNHEQFMTPSEKVSVKIKLPSNAQSMEDKTISIAVEALDGSKWNFFNGNWATAEFKLAIDKRKPLLNILGNSYKISKGGSALVVFKAVDENMKELYIEVGDKKFFAEPFYKEGYYISLIAWSILNQDFKANLVAKDYAGNTSLVYIPLYLQPKEYKVSNIKLDDRFLKGKIAELASEFEETQGVDDSIQQFKIINEKIREKNEKLIHSITSKVPDKMISDFSIVPMYPLRNGQVVAQYGDYRKYSYNGAEVSESYHMGLDLASNAMSEIIPKDKGEIVYADYNGLYGNMPIVSHGLGLYTIYGHCSSVNVTAGTFIDENTVIANTGKSGYAMGDHLHFGVLVQGIEVRPQEWMDAEWIKLNITDVIKSSKAMIEKI